MARAANLIYSRHFTITASASGTETGTVIGVKTRGILDTLVIRKTAGSATYADVEVRLKTGNNNAEYLIYEETAASGAAATLPVRETNIGALFDTLSDDSDDDLYIYLLPRTASGASGATTGTFAVRMDFRIQQ